MESFKQIIKLFKSFNIKKMFDQIMMELSNEIIELNQVEQLSEGIDALDQRIITFSADEQNQGNVYSIFTMQERLIKGLQVSNVDLNYSGIFWKTFKVIKVSDGWEVQADFNLYGDDIRENFDTTFDFLGLTQNNLEVLVYDSVLPLLEKKIKEHLKI